MSQKFIDSVMCPECGCTHVEHNDLRGETTCLRCGLVIDTLSFDDGHGARGFDSEGNSNEGPVTKVWNPNSLGGTFNPRGSKEWSDPKYRRLINIDRKTRFRKASERSTAEAMRELETLSAKCCIPPIVKEDAANIYRNAARKTLVRGRSIKMILAACIYMAFRRMKYPRTFDEVSEMVKVDKRALARDYKIVARNLRMKVDPVDPMLFLPRFCSTLEVSSAVRVRASEILAERKSVSADSGRMPSGTAAAALYLASLSLGEARTQKVFCAATGVTEVTLRNRSREIDRDLNLGLI